MQQQRQGGPLINEDTLSEQTFGDVELCREVLQMFLDQTPALMASLGATQGAARADIAHRIKGSALAIGAMPLAEICDHLQSSPDDGAAFANAEQTAAATLQHGRDLMARLAAPKSA